MIRTLVQRYFRDSAEITQTQPATGQNLESLHEDLTELRALFEKNGDLSEGRRGSKESAALINLDSDTETENENEDSGQNQGQNNDQTEDQNDVQETTEGETTLESDQGGPLDVSPQTSLRSVRFTASTEQVPSPKRGSRENI